MKEESFLAKKKNLPEGFWRFAIVCFIFYAFFIVGKIVYENYQQNKNLEATENEISGLKAEIASLQYKIIYYKTSTYKEKIARSKLRYVLPGETMVAVPHDEIGENEARSNSLSGQISRPNYIYWTMYFFGK